MKAIYYSLIFSLFCISANAQGGHLWQYQENYSAGSNANAIIYYGNNTWIAGGSQDICSGQLVVKIKTGQSLQVDRWPVPDSLAARSEGMEVYKILKTANGDVLTTGAMGVSSDVATLFGGFIWRRDINGKLIWHVDITSRDDKDINAFTALAEADDSNIFAVSGRKFLFKLSPQGKLLWKKRVGQEDIYDLIPMPGGGLLMAGAGGLLRLDSSGQVIWQRHYTTNPVMKLLRINDSTVSVLTDEALYLSDTGGVPRDSFLAGAGGPYHDLYAQASDGNNLYIYGKSRTGAFKLSSLSMAMQINWTRDADGFEGNFDVNGLAVADSTLAIAGTGGRGVIHKQLFINTLDLNGNAPALRTGTTLKVIPGDLFIEPGSNSYNRNVSIPLTAVITNTGSQEVDSIELVTRIYGYDYCQRNGVINNRYDHLALQQGDSIVVPIRIHIPDLILNTRYIMCSFTTGPNNLLDSNINDDQVCLPLEVKDDGIQQTALDEMQIYPNPATDKLFLNNTQGIRASYTLYDINGKELSAPQMLIQGDNEISLASLPAGVYFLKLQSSQGERMQKVMKVR